MAVHLVNPSRSEVDGLRCVPDLQCIDDPVDLAFVTVPAPAVLGALHSAHDQGIRAAIVNSAGFGESGDAADGGRAVQLRAFARSTGMAICGPSSLGLANALDGLDILASGMSERVPPGHVAVISQSGGTVSSIVRSAASRHLGFSHVVSSGSELCANACDYLEYFLRSSEIRVVCLFLEQLSNPDRFLTLCRAAAMHGTAVLCIKIGKSESGQRAALGHTGAITGADAYFETVFDESGVIRCLSIEHMLDSAAGLAQSARKWWPAGGRLGIVTASGGAGTLLADLAADDGLEVPGLDDAARSVISSALPARVRVDNPVDIPAALQGPGRKVWSAAIEAVAGMEGLDAVLVSELHSQTPADIAELARIRSQSGRPIFLTSTSDGVSIAGDETLASLRASELPSTRGAQAAIRALAGAARHAQGRRRVAEKPVTWWDPDGKDCERVRDAVSRGLRTRPSLATEFDWRRVLGSLGLESPREVWVRSGSEAAGVIEFSPPYAVKGVASGLLHKAELGFVTLSVPSADMAGREVDRLLAHARSQGIEMAGCVIQQMVTAPAYELYLSSLSEHGERPVITAGRGGGDVESGALFARRLAPVSDEDARAMVRVLPCPLPASRVAVTATVIMRLSEIALALRDSVSLIELNPVMVVDGSAYVVDTVVRVHESQVPFRTA
jgi:acyl-CoA synthetase (NDP forming)